MHRLRKGMYASVDVCCVCKFRRAYDLGVGLAAPFRNVSLHKFNHMAKQIPFHVESLALDLSSCMLLL